VLETKNKTLEQLEVYFGADADGIAAKDTKRVRNIEVRLGLAGVQGRRT
jgi:hypothetical protein